MPPKRTAKLSSIERDRLHKLKSDGDLRAKYKPYDPVRGRNDLKALDLATHSKADRGDRSTRPEEVQTLLVKATEKVRETEKWFHLLKNESIILDNFNKDGLLAEVEETTGKMQSSMKDIINPKAEKETREKAISDLEKSVRQLELLKQDTLEQKLQQELVSKLKQEFTERSQAAKEWYSQLHEVVNWAKQSTREKLNELGQQSDGLQRQQETQKKYDYAKELHSRWQEQRELVKQVQEDYAKHKKGFLKDCSVSSYYGGPHCQDKIRPILRKIKAFESDLSNISRSFSRGNWIKKQHMLFFFENR